MNNKAIIEFGFRRIWRILQISEGVVHLGLLSSYESRIQQLLNTPTAHEAMDCLFVIFGTY